MKQHFPTVVLIHGVPRSGTSWLGQIFNAHEDVAFRYQPLFSHAFKDRLGPGDSAEVIRRFWREMLETDDDFVCGRFPEIHGSYPHFSKSPDPTHLVLKHVRYHHLLPEWLEKLPDARLVALVRHPCAVLNSWFRAPREFRPEWDRDAEWRGAPSKNRGRPEEFNGFDRWKDAASLFLRLGRRYPDRCRVLRYGDLVADPQGRAEGLLQWVGLEPTDQVRRFIAESGSLQIDDPYAVFKVRTADDRWRAELPARFVDAILSDLRGTELELFLD